MFIRFVVHRTDPGSGRRQGLFQAMEDLLSRGELLQHEVNAEERIYQWFKKNLRPPNSFSRSSKPNPKKVAISWFKSEAVEHVSNMRAYAQILLEHGVEVVELRSERPGYIVYEDEFQVAAEPFKDTHT